MAFRIVILVTAGLLSAAAALAGCGDDDDDLGDGDGDSDADADGDGDGDGDGDADGDADPVIFTGRVVGEADVDPPPLAGVQVELLDAQGEVLDGTATDVDGEYSLTAVELDVAFILAHETPGYAGQLRAQGIREGLRFYDLTLQLESGLQTVHEAVGLTYDTTRGTVVVGYNPVDHDLGGEGASLAPPDHDPPFVLVDDGAVSGERLPPICPNVGVDPCVDGVRSDAIFFPNVVPGVVQLTLQQPEGGTCQVRFGLEDWLVRPYVSTVVDVDCLPD